MSEELDSAVNSLGEQTKKLNIALYYVNGDMQKAKQMVAGSLKDIYALKCNFTSSSLHGAFLIHYNHMSFKINNIFVAVGPSYTDQSIDAGDDWKVFEKAVRDYVETGEQDDILSRTLRDKLTNSFSFLFIGDLNKFLKANNDISLNRMFQKVIQEHREYKIQKMKKPFLEKIKINKDVGRNSYSNKGGSRRPRGRKSGAGGSGSYSKTRPPFNRKNRNAKRRRPQPKKE